MLEEVQNKQLIEDRILKCKNSPIPLTSHCESPKNSNDILDIIDICNRRAL